MWNSDNEAVLTIRVRVDKYAVQEVMDNAGAQMPSDWIAWVEGKESDAQAEVEELMGEWLENWVSSDLTYGQLQEKPECQCDGTGWMVVENNHIKACDECEMFSTDKEAAFESGHNFLYVVNTGAFIMNNDIAAEEKRERQDEIVDIRNS